MLQYIGDTSVGLLLHTISGETTIYCSGVVKVLTKFVLPTANCRCLSTICSLSGGGGVTQGK